MLKKSIQLYSSFILVMIFVFFILFINLGVLDAFKSVSPHNYSKTANNLDINTESSVNLKISTDKRTYSTNEDVLINFENMSTLGIAQKGKSNIKVKSRADLGKNYELAFIEHQKGDDWVAIEPVSRCSSRCAVPCNNNKTIAANNSESYTWPQTVVKCLSGEDSKTEKAPIGSYRVTTASWDAKSSVFKKIHSKPFKISNLSKN